MVHVRGGDKGGDRRIPGAGMSICTYIQYIHTKT